MSDRPKMIEKNFDKFMVACGLGDASGLQRSEMRRAFFAGVRFYLAFIMQHAEAGDEPTDQDMALMDALEVEMENFVRDVEAGLK
jgi:hypothetical protein